MSNLASVIDVDNVICVAQRRCEDLGVTVRFSSYAQTAHTNGKDIVIPLLRQPITQEALDTLYGYLIHETGHHLRPEAFEILKAARPPDHVCALYNIIEDDGMERERGQAWRGDKKALSLMNQHLITKAQQELINIPEEIQDPAPVAAMILQQVARFDWDSASDLLITNIIKALPTNCKTLIEELLKEDWVPRMRKGTNPYDTWDIAIDLAKRLYPNNNEQEYEDIRESGHKLENRDDSEDTLPEQGTPANSPNEEGNEEQEVSNSQEGQGEDDEEAQATDTNEGKTISWRDAVISEHNEWGEKDGPPGSVGIDWTGYTSGDRILLMPTNKINVIDLTKSNAKPHTWNQYMPHNEESRAFANRIRRYIQAEARSTIDKEKYHGKLDKGAIVRLALPPIDKGEYNKKIFYDQRAHPMKDTAIFVLADWSGSMLGNKMVLAADASQRLVHVFDRILKVPVALAAFSNARTRCDIGYIKPYNTRGLPPEEIAKRFAKFRHWCSANNDADSVHWAWREILKRKELRKILIVLSDGCPAGSWMGGNGDNNLEYITDTIEKDGRVELYGVGIVSHAVERYYTNHKVLDTPEEINSTLFNIIREGDKSSGRARQ